MIVSRLVYCFLNAILRIKPQRVDFPTSYKKRYRHPSALHISWISYDIPFKMTDFQPHSLDLSIDVVPLDTAAFSTAIVQLITVILTVIGNSFIFILFWKDRSLRTVPNYLVLSLTVTDWFVGVSRMIFLCLHIHGRAWSAGQIGCQIDGYLTVQFECQSLVGLVALGLERYMAVVKRKVRNLWKSVWHCSFSERCPQFAAIDRISSY